MNEVSLLNLKLLKRAPFVATVALHAEVLVRDHPGVEIAATDGQRIYLSPRGFSPRPVEEKVFIYAHEVLHCSLSHVPRRGTRDPRLWNIAADIVVNGLLIESGFDMLSGGVRDDSLAHLSTEAVYEQLLAKQPPLNCGDGEDLLEGADTDGEGTKGYWQNVLQRAATLARMTQAGTLPKGQELELVLGEQQVDWRNVMLRYLTSTQDDYGAFDTRLIYYGLYVETLGSTGVLDHRPWHAGRNVWHCPSCQRQRQRGGGLRSHQLCSRSSRPLDAAKRQRPPNHYLR